ncbi:uncharacterized protein LOC127538877 isoform X2 [Antechinus flavipes]|uniref:uncharacterized protein LOC127538877 isoform X2 n=1 Tax=Antechinus flavipes TaxID=38775 RepID=UPI002235B712|nr:uncharacterized protein LOC127538877 isoform X2 [Antechinus flavipes]
MWRHVTATPHSVGCFVGSNEDNVAINGDGQTLLPQGFYTSSLGQHRGTEGRDPTSSVGPEPIMANRLLCWVSIFLLGAAPTETGIAQTPRYLVTEVKQEVTLRCQQDLGHDYMYWYQQEPQEGPRIMFYYISKDMSLNETVPPRFQPASSGNGHLTLKIHPVEAEDSATYLCSSSRDTALQSHLPAVQKPPVPGIGRKEGGKSSHQRHNSQWELLEGRGTLITQRVFKQALISHIGLIHNSLFY